MEEDLNKKGKATSNFIFFKLEDDLKKKENYLKKYFFKREDDLKKRKEDDKINKKLLDSS